jgi:hypothetical protein
VAFTTPRLVRSVFVDSLFTWCHHANCIDHHGLLIQPPCCIGTTGHKLSTAPPPRLAILAGIILLVVPPTGPCSDRWSCLVDPLSTLALAALLQVQSLHLDRVASFQSTLGSSSCLFRYATPASSIACLLASVLRSTTDWPFMAPLLVLVDLSTGLVVEPIGSICC